MSMEASGKMSGIPQASIVMATCGRVELLKRTLESIAAQRPPFTVETIVVDDATDRETSSQILALVASHLKPLTRYARHERLPGYANPGPARNLGYRLARAPIVIAQSDDVYHETPDAIERLATHLQPGEFHIATVWNVRGVNGSGKDRKGRRLPRREKYSGPGDERPLFFLGSLWRRDIFAVGGNDESFAEPGYEDDFLGQCMLKRGLKPIFRDDVVGIHQHHSRPPLREPYARMKAVWERRMLECEASGDWTATGGAWEWADE